MPTPDSPAKPEQPDHSWKEIPEVRVQIPDHELLRRVGVGSYGEVWLARNRMGTLRAVKIVHRKKFKDNLPFDRELAGIRRFEPISRTHEGFIDILHIGINEAEGYFYYIMELGDDKIRGPEIDPATYAPKTLSTQITLHGHVSPGECLQWGIALSSALHQLHKHGLVHRDIKPSNIIFVSGVPKLADIGLVAELREARSFVGTEGFIPPEGPGKAQADVYGLGKVLYEAMTGRDRLEFPSLPKDFDQLTDKDLFWEVNTVILHACQNEAAERYETAWNMHADLLLLTSGKSVKRLRELERLLAKGKRIALTALPFVLLAAAGLFLSFREVRHRSELRQREGEIRQRDVGMDIAYGNRLMASGDLLGALPYFVQALDLDTNDPEQEDNHRLRIGSILDQCPRLTHYWKEAGPLISCEFTPDGNSLIVSPAANGHARMYDLESGRGTDILPPTNRPIVTVSSNGKWLSVVEYPYAATLWDAHTFDAVGAVFLPEGVVAASFLPDSARLVVACKDYNARIWNGQSGEVEHTFRGHKAALRCVGSSPDGSLIVTTGQDDTARIWDAKTERCFHILPHAGWVYSGAFSPDGRKLVTACNDHKAHVWDVETGKPILPELDHHDVVNSAGFSPDNRLILTAGLDGAVRLWLADSLRALSPNPVLRLSDRVIQAVFSPDSRRIAAVCNDGSIWVWDLAGITIPVRTSRHYFSTDGRKCVINDTNTFRILDEKSGKEIAGSVSQDLEIKKTGFNCDASLIYTLAVPAGATNSPQLFQLHNISTAEAIAGRVLTLSNKIEGVAVNNDGTRCFVWMKKEADLWDLETRLHAQPGFEEKRHVSNGIFSPCKHRLVVLAGNTARICDSESGAPVTPFLVHEGLVNWAAFSPDESHLLTCSQDNQLTKCCAQIWDTGTGEAIGQRLHHGDGVLFGAFSLDGRKIVTTSEDFTAIIWDAQKGEQLTPVLEHESQVLRAAFTSDGKRVVTASTDASARVWDAQTGAPLTPYLPHISGLVDCRFWGTNLITSDFQERSWVWTLPSISLSVTNLSRLAQMLTAGTIAPSGRLPRFSSKPSEEDYRFLKAAYKPAFTVTAAQVPAWHEYQALAAEHDKHWFTALFHLERLIRQGTTPELIRRRDTARARLTEVSEVGPAE